MARVDGDRELGQQTRERLLAAAERLFAAQGFAAVSVRDITSEASCNVAAVSYHFGGKLGLYREMLLSRLSEVQARRIASVRRAVREAPPERALEEVLRAFATAFLEPLVGRGTGGVIIELIGREMLDPQLPPEAFRAAVFSPVESALTDAILVAVPGVVPGAARRCVMSILGQLVQVAHRVRREQRTGGSGEAGGELDAMIEHVVAFSAAGVRACLAGTP